MSTEFCLVNGRPTKCRPIIYSQYQPLQTKTDTHLNSYIIFTLTYILHSKLPAFPIFHLSPTILHSSLANLKNYGYDKAFGICRTQPKYATPAACAYDRVRNAADQHRNAPQSNRQEVKDTVMLDLWQAKV
jgi:hypothetical protein